MLAMYVEEAQCIGRKNLQKALEFSLCHRAGGLS